MTADYPCTRIKSQPRMNLSICIGRWTEAQGKAKSPCKDCPIFRAKLADLVKEVLCGRP